MQFVTDDNTVLWMIQHHTKQTGIGLLYAEAENRYSAAIRLLSVTTDLWEAIRRHYVDNDTPLDEQSALRKLLNAVEVPETSQMKSNVCAGEARIKMFDHRVLSHAYDIIASAFRFCNSDLWLPLFAKDEIVKRVNTDAWEKFWETEVKRLVLNDRIVIAILTAVAFQNEEAGLAAERELTELLNLEYGDPRWSS